MVKTFRVPVPFCSCIGVQHEEIADLNHGARAARCALCRAYRAALVYFSERPEGICHCRAKIEQFIQKNLVDRVGEKEYINKCSKCIN